MTTELDDEKKRMLEHLGGEAAGFRFMIAARLGSLVTIDQDIRRSSIALANALAEFESAADKALIAAALPNVDHQSSK